MLCLKFKVEELWYARYAFQSFTKWINIGNYVYNFDSKLSILSCIYGLKKYKNVTLVIFEFLSIKGLYKWGAYQNLN